VHLSGLSSRFSVGEYLKHRLGILSTRSAAQSGFPALSVITYIKCVSSGGAFCTIASIFSKQSDVKARYTEDMTRDFFAEFQQISDERLPFAKLMGVQLEAVDNSGLWMRAKYNEHFLRPGGTVAGPIMMGLADAAVYALVLQHVGLVELAVTTNLNINFLRKPEPGDVLAHASPLKIGKRLLVGEVSLFSAVDNESAENAVRGDRIAHATATYSIPPAPVA